MIRIRLIKTVLFLVLLESGHLLFQSSSEEETKLLLVQTIFRHGDRAPIILYPNDPNSAESWPEGLAQLTKLGKKQHYAVGNYIRWMYKDFLTSDPKEIFVNSSAAERCLSSALSNVAALSQPEDNWKIEDQLAWQPITVHYKPAELDKYLSNDGFCPRAYIEYYYLSSSEEALELIKKHKKMLEKISYYSGVNTTDLTTIMGVHDTLFAEKSHNLLIPEWVDPIWDEWNELAFECLQGLMDQRYLLRLRVGPWMGLLKNNMLMKINGDMPDLKFIMNAAHDINVAAVLRALDIKDMPRPPYCATLLFELHEMSDSSMAVRVLYLNSTNPLDHVGKPHVLVLNDCTEFCPLEDFSKKFEYLVPGDWIEECRLEIPELSEEQ